MSAKVVSRACFKLQPRLPRSKPTQTLVWRKYALPGLPRGLSCQSRGLSFRQTIWRLLNVGPLLRYIESSSELVYKHGRPTWCRKPQAGRGGRSARPSGSIWWGASANGTHQWMGGGVRAAMLSSWLARIDVNGSPVHGPRCSWAGEAFMRMFDDYDETKQPQPSRSPEGSSHTDEDGTGSGSGMSGSSGGGCHGRHSSA